MLSKALIFTSLLCVTYGGAIRYAAPQVLQPSQPYTAPVAKAVYTRDASPVIAYRGPNGPVYLQYDSNPHYSYAYQVQDYHTGDSKGQQETRHGDVVEGSYNVVDPDGSRRVVDYRADDRSGFNAVVHREPAPAIYANKIATLPVQYSQTNPHYANGETVAYAAPGSIFGKSAYLQKIPLSIAPLSYATPAFKNYPSQGKVFAIQSAADSIYTKPETPIGDYLQKIPVAIAKVVPNAGPLSYATPVLSYGPSQGKGFAIHNAAVPIYSKPEAPIGGYLQKIPVAIAKVVPNTGPLSYATPALSYGPSQGKGFAIKNAAVPIYPKPEAPIGDYLQKIPVSIGKVVPNTGPLSYDTPALSYGPSQGKSYIALPIYANEEAAHYVNPQTPTGDYFQKVPVSNAHPLSYGGVSALRYDHPQRKGFPLHAPVTKYTGPLILETSTPSAEARYVPYNVQATPVVYSTRYEAAYASSEGQYSRA